MMRIYGMPSAPLIPQRRKAGQHAIRLARHNNIMYISEKTRFNIIPVNCMYVYYPYNIISYMQDLNLPYLHVRTFIQEHAIFDTCSAGATFVFIPRFFIYSIPTRLIISNVVFFFIYRLTHPNIVQLLETFEDKSKVYLIMEL